MPHHFDIYEGFRKNLEHLGFKIVLLYTSGGDFRYDHPLQKVSNFIHKLFGDRNYKNKLKAEFDDKHLLKSLSQINEIADYTLVIRPDYFSSKVLQALKAKTKHFIGYQWDGLNRYPKVMETIPLFERFYVFDSNDYTQYHSTFQNIHSIQNFYFDFCLTDQNVTNKTKDQKVFFIGSFIENRISSIVNLTASFQKMGLKTDINILYFNETIPEKYRGSGITFIRDSLTYLEVLDKIRNTDIIVDFANSIHNGLSFRIFESIGFSKKIITTNAAVKNYDFYDPNNILIWDSTMKISELQKFLSEPYHELDAGIKLKYSFTSWLQAVLQMKNSFV